MQSEIHANTFYISLKYMSLFIQIFIQKNFDFHANIFCFYINTLNQQLYMWNEIFNQLTATSGCSNVVDTDSQPVDLQKKSSQIPYKYHTNTIQILHKWMNTTRSFKYSGSLQNTTRTYVSLQDVQWCHCGKCVDRHLYGRWLFDNFLLQEEKQPI